MIRSLLENPGDLTKDDIADDLEWPLEVISGPVNGFVFVSPKYSI